MGSTKDSWEVAGALTAAVGTTATTGNVTATAGNVVATAGNLVATAGDIDAPLGDITVGDEVATYRTDYSWFTCQNAEPFTADAIRIYDWGTLTLKQGYLYNSTWTWY